MRRISRSSTALVCLLALIAAVGLTACGGGDSSSGSTTADGSKSEGSSGESGRATAKAAIEPYVGQPSPFPVTEKLKELPPAGSTFAYMSPGVTYSELIGELAKQGAGKLGAEFETIKAGLAANTVSSAFDSVVAKDPAAVIVSALEPELYSKQLKELLAAETPVVVAGPAKAEEYGVKSPVFGTKMKELYGKLQADYVVAEWGPEANVVFYEVPEYGFTPANTAGFKKEFESTCPNCSLRFTPIAASTFGNTAPSAVVSDLQANPETNVAVFESGEIESGLSTALDSAGITIKSLTGSPGPANYQAVKEGKETAALAVDTPVLAWTLVDMAARELAGQELTGDEAEGVGDIQFLTKKDITFDTEKGWTGYPDYAEKFEKLWGVGG
jgi:ribose transport system substrate-binding protein